MASVQEIAREMLRLFGGDPSRWTQKTFARDARGAVTLADGPDATSWSILGAQLRVIDTTGATPVDRAACIRAMSAAVECSIDVWNDDPSRTFEDVQKLPTELAETP